LPSGGAAAPFWLRFWILLLLVPASFALVSMSPTWAVVAVILTFGLPLAIWLGLHVHDPRQLPGHLAEALRFAAAASVSILGLVGLFLFSAALGWATLAAYVATTLLRFGKARPPAPAPRAVEDTGRPAPAPHTKQSASATTDDALHKMTDAELCRAWRSSFVALQQARSLHLRFLIVQTRQHLLDEIDARHPAGLQAWLASGARAASGPDRFIDPKSGRDRPEAA
jgi:hypothetical protein